MWGTRRWQSGGTEEEDKVGNAHERVTTEEEREVGVEETHREDNWRRREQ